MGSERVTHPPVARGAPFEVNVPIRFTMPPWGPEAGETLVVEGLIVPVPMNVTNWDPEGALSKMVKLPVWGPEVGGVKVTWIVQLAPGPMMTPVKQSADSVKFPKPLPYEI